MFLDGNLFFRLKENWISNFLLKTGFDEKYFPFQKLKIKNVSFIFHFKNWIFVIDLCFNIQSLIRGLDIKFNWKLE